MKKASLVALCAACLVGGLLPAPASATDGLEAALAAPRVPGEVVVRFEAGTSSSERVSARAGVDASDHSSLGLPGLEVMELDGTSVRDAIAELEADPDVAYAEPNYIVSASGTPDDPFFHYQWALHDDPGDVDIDAPAAWDTATGTDNVTVAVVDTGVAWDHPDLAENIWTNPGESGTKATNGVDDDGNGLVDDVRGWDWVDRDNDPMDVSGHGTHVAGTIGARGDNGTGVSGVGQTMKLMPLRVLSASGSGSTADVARAFNYAARMGAKVVNASFGGSGYSQAMAETVGTQSGVLFVAASGNESANNDVTPAWPCNLPYANVICVAALQRSNSLASYSNTGPASVDLAAPGSSILSTVPHREVLFSESFESDASARWSTGGTSTWGPESGPSGSAYSDSPAALYADNADSYLQLIVPIDVSDANGCALSYSAKLATSNNDVMKIESSKDGTTWRDVIAYSGSTDGWTTLTNDLGSYLGDSLYLRFRLRSDGWGTNDGVAIDDVSVRCAMSQYSTEDYRYFSGTSMATPHVSGAAGVLFSAAPLKTVADIRFALLSGTKLVPSAVGLVFTNGRLNLASSLAVLTGVPQQPSAPAGDPAPPASSEPSGPSSGAPAPTPTATPSPTPTPTPTPDIVEHDRAVSLTIVRGPRVKGRIQVADGFEPCASGASVSLHRNGYFLRTVTADEAGRFVARVPSYRGRYTAKLSPSAPTGGHLCSATRSSTVR